MPDRPLLVLSGVLSSPSMATSEASNFSNTASISEHLRALEYHWSGFLKGICCSDVVDVIGLVRLTVERRICVVWPIEWEVLE